MCPSGGLVLLLIPMYASRASLLVPLWLISALVVRWKFIPICPQNSAMMARLQSNLHPEHMRAFYKGAILSDETLRRLGFVGFQEVIQQPGDVMASHSFHCGLGMHKLAEAHSWFSNAWYRLRLHDAPELPIFCPWTPDAVEETSDETHEEEGAGEEEEDEEE